MLPWCGAKSVSVISGGESNIINRVRETVLAFCSSSNRMPYDGSVRLHSTAILSEHYFYKYLKSVPAVLWSEVMPDHVKVCWSLLINDTLCLSPTIACLTTTDWTVLNGTTVEIFVNIPKQKVAFKYQFDQMKWVVHIFKSSQCNDNRKSSGDQRSSEKKKFNFNLTEFVSLLDSPGLT